MIIPFSFLPVQVLKKQSSKFLGISSVISKALPLLNINLTRSNSDLKADNYIAYCLVSLSFLFLMLSLVFAMIMDKFSIAWTGIIISFIVCFGIFILQVNFPAIEASKRIKKVDLELLPALRTMIIQLNSGLPLFNAMVTISKQDFGEVSKEFEIAIREISAGVSQKRALEQMIIRNPSPYFRRTIWQILSGLQSGARIADVIERVVENLSREQVIQIEKYGSQLNPIAMFYMMVVVILPSLGITFLIVITSFLGVSSELTELIFGGLFVFVLFAQIMFRGVVKQKRPALLGE